MDDRHLLRRSSWPAIDNRRAPKKEQHEWDQDLAYHGVFGVNGKPV
jgi:hypothetical protein